MSSLGSLYYTLGLDSKQLEADIQRINKRLESMGVNLTVNPVLAKSINDILPKGVNVEITPNKVAQEALDRAIEGKAVKAEVLPLADRLKSAVVDTLKDTVVPLNGITIPPDKITAAVTAALSSANFTAVGEKAGDELAKAIRVKVEGQRYEATITAKTDKLTDAVNKALKAVFDREQKIKLDRSGIREFREELRKTVSESVKVTPTLNVTQDALQRAVEGKVMRVEILPLVTNLRAALKNAFAGNPAEIEVGPNAAKLRDTITRVCLAQGYMVNISTVTGLEHQIRTITNGRVFDVKLTVDPRILATSLQQSMANMQSKQFGLTVAQDILRKSIDDALRVKPFEIQIKVMQNQARQAVQNALNNASNISSSDALKYQRLQTGELRAAQAELARLRAEQLGAAKAASTHTSASVNLGGALGSNIKIAGELGAAMASLYSVHAAKQFLSQVIEIGGELEHQKIALETIYGTESKMESLYGQIKSLARQSPFGVMELTKNVKQLSAYGVAYNEVYDTAKRLADISAATSVDIQRLILAFGKTKNRTFLDGLEAKQFAYANIPIYDELSKKLTELEGKFVSVKDVMGRIKKREIGFDMVKDILWDMTDEGGKFYNMQEKLAGSVKTSWKLVRDNIELMFGEIAESGVGDFLKGIGQTLQEVTRNWQALTTIIGVGGGAFGVYKLAVMGTNVLLEKQTTDLVANHLAEKNAQAARLRSIGLTGALTAKQRELIASRNTLTAADLKQLQTEKSLTAQQIKRLYLTGKITRAQLQEAVTLGVVNQKQFELIAGTNKYYGAMHRLRAMAAGTWATIKSGVASAFGMVFNWTTAAFAAIAGITYLIQHNMQENEIAEDFTKTWKQKGEDVAKELSETLKKPFENLTAPQADQLIEEYKNKIRDFATLPEDIISRAIYDKDGKILDTANQIKNLRKELETLQQTAEGMNLNLGTVINATGDGIFNEDLITNLKDWQKDFNSLDAAVLKFVNDNKDRAKEIVKTAANASSAYADEIKNIKNLSEQLAVLLRNRTKYNDAWKAVNGADFWGLRGGGFFSSLWKTITFQSTPNKEAQWHTLSANDAIKDLKDAIEGFKNTHEDWDWDNLTEAQEEEVRQFFKKIIETAEISSPELKAAISNIFENAFGVDLISEEEAKQKIANALNKGLNEEVGKTIFEKVKNGLKLSPEEAEKVHQAFEKIYAQLYEKVPDIQKEALEKATKQQTASGLVWSANKEMQIIATLNVRTDWENWQREIDDATGNLKPIQTWIKGAPDIASFVKAAQEGYKEAQASVDKLKPLMVKAGIQFEFGEEIYTGFGSLYQGLSEASKQMVDQYNEQIRVLKAGKIAGEKYGFDPSDKKKKETDNRPHRDTLASKFKAEFADLRDGWAEVQKLADSLGFDAAMKKVENSPLFGNYKWGEGPKSLEDYRKEIFNLRQKLYDSGIVGHPERETLFNDMTKKLFEIDRTLLEQKIQSALDTVSQEVERQTADWNLFDKIRKATGNQDLAMSIAFGMNTTAETDYPAMVKKQFDEVAKAAKSTLTFDTVTPELLKDAPEEVRKAWEKAYSDIQKYRDKEREEVADMVAQYRNTQEEIIAITAQAEEKKRKIRDNKDLSPVQKQQITERIDADLNYQVFQKSGEYLKFFNAILSMTGKEAENVGKKIKEALDDKLKAGTISAKDYCEEMEKIDKQLDIIRNKQKGFGGFGSFAKGGLQQMFQDRFEQVQSDYNKAVQNFDTAKQQFDIFSKEGNEAGMEQAQSAMDAASAMKEGAGAAMDGAQGALQTVAIIDTIVHGINDTVQGIRDAFYSIQDMADSFGVDTSADTDWGKAGAFLDAFSQASEGATKAWDSLKSGNIGGVISGVVQSVTSWFTVFNRWHDAKLQKQIERSQEIVDNIQRAYDKIERRMANFLGNGRALWVTSLDEDKERLRILAEEKAMWESIPDNVYGKKYRQGKISSIDDEIASIAKRGEAYKEGGAYGYQRQLMSEQLAELEKQRQLELEKKKSDDSVVKDYEDQIDEMKVKIQEFGIEAAKAVYGIDLNSWAQQIGDDLVDAFSRGEDAAEAFDKSVGNIMRSLVSKMISQDILADMFNDVRDYLFGENGVYSKGSTGGDFKLSAEDAAGLADRLSKIKGGIADAQEIYDEINRLSGGLLDDTEKSKSGMTKGLQSLTENTGDLLASYVNDGRASLSVIRTYLEDYFNSSLPQMNVIAESQLQAQRQIAENTLRNAVAAEAILKSNESIHRLLSQVANGGARFYVK